MKKNFSNGCIKDYQFLQLLRMYKLEPKQYIIGAKKDLVGVQCQYLVYRVWNPHAGLQLRINPKMVDDITQLIQDKEDKQKLIDQLSQAQQKQVNLEVSNSPRILKAKLEQKESGLFGNILTALRCWDKKQK